MFVGRSWELSVLRRALGTAAEGGLGAVTVVGEPGIGKTALLDRFVAEVSDGGAVVARGRGWDGGEARPFRAWIQLFGQLRARDALIGDEVDQLAAIERGLTRGADGPDPAFDGADAARLVLFDAVDALLTSISSRRPLVLVLDDAHGLDAASLRLLRYLADTIAASPLLVVAHRDTEVDRVGLGDALAALAARRGHRHLALVGLGTAEIAQLVESELGEAASIGVVDALEEATEGSPLFLHQFLGLIGDLPGAAKELEAGELRVPDSVIDVIERRLRALPDDGVVLLQVAAVIGRDFDLDLLEAIPATASVDVVGELDRAERARLVFATGPASWRFGHDVVRKALYQRVGTARRSRLHREVALAAEALRAAGGSLSAATLAHHYGQAGTAPERRRAAAFAREAAHDAMAVDAYEDAARLMAWAGELSAGDPGVTSHQAFEDGLFETQARFLGGDFDGGRRVAGTLIRLAREGEDPGAIVEVALCYSRPGSRFVQDDEGLQLVRQALERVEPGTREHVLLEAHLALELQASDPTRARQLSAEALERARAFGDPVVVATALAARRYAVWNADAADELLAIGEELVDLGTAAAWPQMTIHGHFTLRSGYHELGDLAAMDRQMARVDDLAARYRLPVDRAWVQAHEAMRLALAGRFREAQDLMARAGAVAQHANDDQLSVQLVPLQVLLARELGDGDGALALLRGVAALRPGHALVESALAHTRSILGDAVLTTELEVAVDRCCHATDDWLRNAALAEAASCAHRIRDVAAATRLRPLLEPYAARGRVITCGPTVTFGAAAHYVGLCADTMGDPDAAVAALTAAVELHGEMGAIPAAIRSNLALADVLGRRGAPGDERGRDDARHRARSLAAQLEPCLVVAEAQHDPTRRRAADLSAREVEILRLVASGATNREIAADVHASVKTVERHLGNLYTKLGVRNRAGATAWALRHELG